MGFNQAKVDVCIRFIESLKHTNSHRGQPFTLAPFQRDIISRIFGPTKGSEQLINEVMLMLPKKAGKTELCAALSLFFLFGQGEERGGEQIIMAASSANQARYMYNAAVDMRNQDPWLSSMFQVFNSTMHITYPKLNNKIVVLSSDADRVHGINPSVVFADELSFWKNEKLYGALEHSMGTRERTLWVSITHAGHNINGLAYQRFEYAKKVKERIFENERFLPILYYAEPHENYLDETLWARVNPQLGEFYSIEKMRAEAAKAKLIPTAENEFRMYHLNQWVGQEVRWLPMDRWKDCPRFTDDDLRGRACYAGFDLGRSSDFSALLLAFPAPDPRGICYVKPHFWLPKLADPSNADYQRWDKEGFLTLTEGDTADQERILEDVLALHEKYNISTMALDPAGTDWIGPKLQSNGINAFNFQPHMKWMSPPSIELERLVTSKLLAHNNHPVLRYMASNVSCDMNRMGERRPIKYDRNKRSCKVDGIVALVLALGASQRETPQAKRGVVHI